MIHSMNGGAVIAFAKDGVAQFRHHFITYKNFLIFQSDWEPKKGLWPLLESLLFELLTVVYKLD